MTDLEQFTKFLAGVDLAGYRAQYLPIKIVEMDMPKDIQAIELLYEVYWNERKPLSFEDFYARYLSTYKKPLEIFRKKTTMCKDCFYRGLPARIYRTWASIITQIHAGYVAESIFGSATVAMSVALDHQGADFQVTYRGHVLNYQVKKNTQSREVRREKKTTKVLAGKFINIEYQVPNSAVFDNPKKRNGDYRLPYLRFIANKSLTRLPNGFVIFTPHAFLAEKEECDKSVTSFVPRIR